MEAPGFRPINRGYGSVFQPGRLTLGLVVPIETYDRGPVPTMQRHLDRARLADDLGFAALWLRDVPFNVPSFGDAGQPFDPLVYLGALAMATERIALGVASIILPLRHPAHVARAAASADVLSGGRLLLGIAPGDRPDEYPALAQPFEERGERFRDAYAYLRRMAARTPTVDSPYGRVGAGMDLLPKPVGERLPLLVTGSSRQAPDRERVLATGPFNKPVMQPLYVALDGDPAAPPRPLHLGFRSGANALTAYLRALEDAGVNHVALNLRFNRADTAATLRRLAAALLPAFPTPHA